MSPKSTSTPSGVLETIQVPATNNAALSLSTTANATMDAKDTRSTLRSRKVVMKPHDRTKARTGRGHDKYSKTDNERIRRKRQNACARGVFDVDDVDAAAMENSALEYSVKDVENETLSIFSGPRTPLEVVEVPLLTIIQTSKPWDGVGADFELVSNPGDVIALDDDMEYSDDEWEAVDDMNKKPAKPVRKSYAAALQAGIKA